MTNNPLVKTVANAIAEANQGTGTWANTICEAQAALAALGLDDLDAAVERITSTKTPEGFTPNETTAKTMLSALLATQAPEQASKSAREQQESEES